MDWVLKVKCNYTQIDKCTRAAYNIKELNNFFIHVDGLVEVDRGFVGTYLYKSNKVKENIFIYSISMLLKNYEYYLTEKRVRWAIP